MNLLQLSVKSVLHRKFATTMTCISIAFSVALLLGVERIRQSGKESFGGAISKTDLIVGARTGNISLLLYSVFRIGSPNQNVDLETARTFAKHPAVSWVEPFSLGDGYKGFPVVGTEKTFFDHYKYQNGRDLSFAQGQVGDDSNYAVLGYLAARNTGHNIGDKIVISHGHSEDGDGFETHDDSPLVVSGILSFTGTPIDRAVWISLESMDSMHKEIDDPMGEAQVVNPANSSPVPTAESKPEIDSDHDHDHDEDHAQEKEHGHDHDHEEDQETTEVSGFFVATKDRSAALTLMREINEFQTEPLTAVMPAVVLNELWRTLAVGERALSLVSAMVALVGICGMWVSLHILAYSRKREIAVLRASGASSTNIIAMMTGEAVLLCLIGVMLGMVFLYVGLSVLTPLITSKYGISIAVSLPSATEYIYICVMLVASALAGLIPAVQAYKSSLQDGLSVRF